MQHFNPVGSRTYSLQEFRWIAVTEYVILPQGSDIGEARQVLQSFIASPAYRDSFLSPNSWMEMAGNWHGPFVVDRISIADFEVLSPEQFVTEAAEVLWNTFYEEPRDEVIDHFELAIGSMPKQAAFFALKARHEPAAFMDDQYVFQHEFSSEFWEFVEFVAIDGKRNILTVFTIGFD